MAQNSLDRFGELLMKRVRDEAIADWDSIVRGGMKDDGSQRIATKVAAAGPDAEQLVSELIPRIVDTTLHHLLWTLEQEEEVVEVYVRNVGEPVNIIKQSDGLAGELYDWVPRFSKQRFHNPADDL